MRSIDSPPSLPTSYKLFSFSLFHVNTPCIKSHTLTTLHLPVLTYLLLQIVGITANLTPDADSMRYLLKLHYDSLKDNIPFFDKIERNYFTIERACGVGPAELSHYVPDGVACVYEKQSKKFGFITNQYTKKHYMDYAVQCLKSGNIRMLEARSFSTSLTMSKQDLGAHAATKIIGVFFKQLKTFRFDLKPNSNASTDKKTDIIMAFIINLTVCFYINSNETIIPGVTVPDVPYRKRLR